MGKVLEGLLNRLGVWYFWQIASWSTKEIEHVDRHLEAFKGRINRDSWVTQAQRLAKDSTSHPPQTGDAAPLGLSEPSKSQGPARSTET